MIKLLKNGNFTKLFLGRAVSNIGDSLYAIAAMWLVYELGGSTFYTGLAGFLTMIPSMFQFLVGPIVDKVSLKKLLVITQLFQFTFVLSIPLFHFAGVLNVSLLLIIMPILAFVNQFIFPAQSAALPKIVDSNDLVAANSLFSFANQGVNILATSVGGAFIVILGAISIYVWDALLFLIAVFIFLSLKLPKSLDLSKTAEKQGLKSHTKGYIRDLIDGYTFVKRTIISKFFYGSVAANFSFGMAMAVLPAYSNDRGGAELYGVFMGTFSAGYLAGVVLSSYSAIAFAIGSLGMLFVSAAWLVASELRGIPKIDEIDAKRYFGEQRETI
jgi:MFS family permease